MTESDPSEGDGALPGPSLVGRVRSAPKAAWAALVANARSERLPAVLRIGWQDAIIPLLAFFSSFLWLGPATTYLYGQDSYSFVLPFAYQNSPFVASHYNAQSLYTYVVIDGLTGATGSPFVAERLILAAFVGLAALGFVQLFRVINVARGRPAGSAWLGKLLGTAVFVWNPFMLSVVWQHVEGWTFFPVLLPFALTLLFEVHYIGVSLRRVAFIVLVSLPLAPGGAGTYLFILGYAFLFFAALELVLALARRIRWRTFFARFGVYLVTDLLISGWASVQYFGSPLVPSASAASLQNLFVAESGTTSLLNVLTLTAYSPIAYAPSYFPWIGFLPWLVFAGLLMILVTTVLVAHAIGGHLSVVWALMTLPIVIAMTGANFPGGPLDARLLALGGPFDVLVNPYYFLAPYYCAFLGYVVYRTVDELVPIVVGTPAARRALRWVQRPSVAPWREPDLSPTTGAAFRRSVPSPQAGGVSRAIAAGTLVMVLVGVGIFAQPFVTGQVYQSQGTFISEEQVPADYPALAQYFAHDYPGPVYNVLVLPTSSDGATYHAFNGDNSTFPDSEGLLASYIPYPTIWRYPQGTLLTSESPLYGAVENVTANLSGTATGIVGMLDAIHVRFVVVDEQYLARKSMLYAPNGAPYDLGAIERGLNSTLGAPAIVGEILVYTNLAAAPLVTAESFADTLAAPTLADYLGLVSSFPDVASSPVVAALRDAAWSPTPVPGGFSAYPYFGGNLSLDVPSGTAAYFVGANGSLTNRSPGATVAGNVLTVSPSLVAAGNLATVYDETPRYSSGCFLTGTPQGNGFGMRQPLDGWPIFSSNITVNLSEPSDLFTLTVQLGHNLQLAMNLQHHGVNQYLLAGVVGDPNGSYFGWNNTAFHPRVALAGPLRLTVELTDRSLTFGLANRSGGLVSDDLFFGLGTVDQNGGYNLANYPNGTAFDPSRLGAWLNWTVGTGTTMCGSEIEEVPPVHDVVFAPTAAAGAPVAYNVSADGAGDFTVRISTTGLSTVYVSMLSTSTGDWRATLDGVALPSIVASNPFHVYAAPVPRGAASITISIGLVNHVPLALAAGVVEGVAVGGFGLVLAVVALRGRRTGLP